MRNEIKPVSLLAYTAHKSHNFHFTSFKKAVTALHTTCDDTVVGSNELEQ